MSSPFDKDRRWSLAPSFDDEPFTVSFEATAHRVTLRRTGLAFSSLVEVQEAFDKIHQALDEIPRLAEADLLIDLREGPGRNDPEFESIMVEERARLLSRFRRIAFVVRMIAGRLQLLRHLEQSGLEATVSLSEAEAIRELQR